MDKEQLAAFTAIVSAAITRSENFDIKEEGSLEALDLLMKKVSKIVVSDPYFNG